MELRLGIAITLFFVLLPAIPKLPTLPSLPAKHSKFQIYLAYDERFTGPIPGRA